MSDDLEQHDDGSTAFGRKYRQDGRANSKEVRRWRPRGGRPIQRSGAKRGEYGDVVDDL